MTRTDDLKRYNELYDRTGSLGRMIAARVCMGAPVPTQWLAEFETTELEREKLARELWPNQRVE